MSELTGQAWEAFLSRSMSSTGENRSGILICMSSTNLSNIAGVS